MENFPRIQYVAAQRQSQKFTVQIGRNTRKFHKKNSIHVDVQRHFLWNKRQWKRMSGKRSTRIFVWKKIWKGQWSFIGPGSEKKWYSMKEDGPQGIWDNLAEKMLIEFAESGCPMFRATTPLSRGQLKSKGHGKLSIHFAAVQQMIETKFSHNCFCKPAQFLRNNRGDM